LTNQPESNSELVNLTSILVVGKPVKSDGFILKVTDFVDGSRVILVAVKVMGVNVWGGKGTLITCDHLIAPGLSTGKKPI